MQKLYNSKTTVRIKKRFLLLVQLSYLFLFTYSKKVEQETC